MDRLAAMETFVRVVETGSFSAAAKQLRIGQPAVSKAVAQIEARLNVRLLLRSTHGLTPTEAGRNFYERARRSIEEAEEAEFAARDAGAALSGRLRISGPVTFSRLHVVPHLPILLAEHPNLEIDVVLDDREIDLIGAGIDVALRMDRLRDSSLTARKIGQSPRRVVGAPSYFQAVGLPSEPADLTRLQSVIYDQHTGGDTWVFRQGATTVEIALQGRLRVSAAEGVREGVLTGLGFAIASEWMFAPELASGAVSSVLNDWSLPPIDLWVVFPTGRQATAKARAFADFIESRISASAG